MRLMESSLKMIEDCYRKKGFALTYIRVNPV